MSNFMCCDKFSSVPIFYTGIHEYKFKSFLTNKISIFIRAGMLESFLVCPGELTDDQVMELLKISFRQPEVVLALAKMVHDVHERSNVQNPLE